MEDIEINNVDLAKFMANQDEGTDPLLQAHMDQLNIAKAQKGNKMYKAIVDFKARVLDFVSIYVKEQGTEIPTEHVLLITKGLLEAMAIAFQDKNTQLFDRIQTVLFNMMKETGEKKDSTSNKDSVIIITELMRKILSPKVDKKVLKLYKKCFFFLTKTYAEGSEENMQFVITTYRELAKKASHTLDINFFYELIDQGIENNQPQITFSLFNLLLQKMIPKSEDAQEGGQTAYKRGQATLILSYLVKRVFKNKDDTKLIEALQEKFELLHGTTKVILDDYKKLGNKKNKAKTAKKELQGVLSLYLEALKSFKLSSCGFDFSKYATETMTKLESMVEEDATLSNLKGRIP